jgi:DNA-binding transcriptional LysR family regulator
MRGTEFAELRAFVAVAERSSFGRAAAHLGLTPSTISQTVKSLEGRLGLRLFERTTRNVSLTDAGERLLARVRPALVELDAAIDDPRQMHKAPSGTLRLNVSSIAAEMVLAPAMKAFLAEYPGIILDVIVDDAMIDFDTGHFDARIRMGRRADRDMRMVRLSEGSRLIAVASQDYLERHAAPSAPLDLHRHDCIRMRSGTQFFAWEFERGKNKFEIAVNGPLIVNNMDMLVRATLDGIGVGYTIEAFVADHIASGRLVPLLLDWSPPHHSYYLYYSGRGQLPVPLQTFIAFFRER